MKSVLIVDDSMYMRSLISDALTKAGFDVVGQASNGQQAIDMALKHKPDLITLDNILPDMIGIDILRVLKQDEGLAAKIVMVSAVGQESVVKEGMGLGAATYIVKPFTSEGLMTAINGVFAA
jgi:two-component system, chemotaxis family, chemotaxis protein CheY